MHQVFVFLAFCGFAYGAIAICALGSGWSPELEEDEESQAHGQGVGSGVFVAIASFLALPLRAPLYALSIAVLMAVPALLF